MIETDEQLIKRFVDGDLEAFSTLVERWEHQILNFSYRYLNNEEMARDVVQEVLLRLYLSLNKFRGQSKFSTFLYRVTINCCINLHRKIRHTDSEIPIEDLKIKKSGNIILDTPVTPQTETPLEVVNRELLREKVRNALEELPEGQKIVIIMKEYSGMKFTEISKILGVPESTVKSRMYKGLLNLKKILKRRGITNWSDCA